MDANTFIDALRRLETDRDPDPLAALYADGAVAGNTAIDRQFTGQDGAREFWSRYRDAFDTIESQFRNVVEQDGVAILEWTSTAKTDGGPEFEYEGVTVVVTDGERITRSTAYFDPRALIPA